MLLTPFVGSAQFTSNFIAEVASGSVNLSTQEQASYAAVQADALTKSTKFVALGDVAQLQVDGKLHFLLPGIADTLKASATVVDYQDSLNYSWAGRLQDDRGYVTIMRNPGGYYGRISWDTNSFEVLPLSTGKYLLVEKENTTASYSCVTTDASGSTDDLCLETEVNTCPATVTVLFLVTPDAQTWLNKFTGWGYWLLLHYPAEVTNMAFYNSDVPNKSVRIVVDPEPFLFAYHGDDDGAAEAQDLADPTNSNGDAALVRRELFQADMVFVLTSHDLNIIDNSGNLIGLGAGVVADIGPQQDKAFGLLHIQTLNEGMYFGHEFGHLAGCRHQRSKFNSTGADDEGDCGHGKCFLTQPQPSNYESYLTVLASPFPPAPNLKQTRIPYYSNPDVSYLLGPTGENTSNNAKVLRDNLCTVDGWWPSTSLQVGIARPATRCGRTYSAVITPASGPGNGQVSYSYTWYWNNTGIFSILPHDGTLLPSNGPTVDLTGLPCSFFLCLVVISSEGTWVQRVVHISFSQCEECAMEPDPDPNQHLLRPGGHFTTLNPVAKHLHLSPNPLPGGGQLQVDLPPDEGRERTLQVLDFRGVVVFEEKAPPGNRVELTLPVLPSGIYTLRAIGGQRPENARFAIVNQ